MRVCPLVMPYQANTIRFPIDGSRRVFVLTVKTPITITLSQFALQPALIPSMPWHIVFYASCPNRGQHTKVNLLVDGAEPAPRPFLGLYIQPV